MKNINGMTPKEAAMYETMMNIEADYNQHTNTHWHASEMADGTRSKKFERKFRRQLAKLHNKLYDQLVKSFDGDVGFCDLDENPPKSKYL